MMVCFVPGIARVLRYISLVTTLSWWIIILVTVTGTSSGRILTNEHMKEKFFLNDILTPYSHGNHGSSRRARDVSSCQHFVWQNRTYEEYRMSTQWSDDHVQFEVRRFADVVHKSVLRKRYAVGTVAVVDDPFHSFSILEPKNVGGCQRTYFSTQRSTVQETVKQRHNGCRLGANGGFFNVHSGDCLGNLVADGRIIKSTNGIANANFGIKEDGTIVVGYISDRDIYNKSNPFRQLVSGVIWLVRNGTNYVNESMKIECSDTEDTGSMKTFVEVLSARSAIGHDSKGRLILAHVEGQTHVRGANLYEFADILIRKGVINAINLDGGGSTTFVQDNLLMNYPSDHCHFDAKYRCPREVSTVLCIHDPECLDPTCSNHGSCDKGACTCDDPWTGKTCNLLNCSLANCSNSGMCVDGKCQCTPGYTGVYCNKECPPNRYGLNCAKSCYCYGKSRCHPIYGNCTCPSGLMGSGCFRECSNGYYGPNCQHKCLYPDCSDHGYCSKKTGVCICEQGWSGEDCNSSVIVESVTTQFPSPSLLPSPTFIDVSEQSLNELNDSLLDTTSSSIMPPSSPTQLPVVNSTTQLSLNSTGLPLCDNLSIINVPSSSVNESNTTSIVTVVIIACFVTVIVHILLCVFTIHCRSGMGVASSRAEIKQELMEKRQWEQLLKLAKGWSSDSNDSS